MRVLVITALVVAAAAQQNFYRLPQPYSYTCQNNKCVRQLRAEAREHHSRELCSLTCGEHVGLMPKPTGETQFSKQVVHFDPYNIQVTKVATSNRNVAEMLDEATRYFIRNLHFQHPDFPKSMKTPYTEEVQQPFNEQDQQEQLRSNQFRFDDRAQFFQDRQSQRQRQRQRPQVDEFQRLRSDFTQSESVYEPRTYEQWERHTPFRNQRYNSKISRHNVNLEYTITSPEERFNFDETDESYNMVVQTLDDETTVTILATTYFGARHALETLSQLITYDNENEALMMIKDAKIQDQPQYRYRGLTLDTGRNFFTKQELLSLLDSMSQNKMNALHWHITDAASFPLYLNRVPQMAYYGAYGPSKVYHPQDISEIVEYAQRRGIQVIPELDAPAHMNAGWSWGEKEGKGKLVLCTGAEGKELPWFELGKEPPSGQINPTNPEVYNVLGDIYRDMIDYFNPEMFHMGGDDVSFKCWQNSDEIIQYLNENKREANSREFFELWNTFQNNAFAKLREADGVTDQTKQVKPIVYSSSFARNYLDKDVYTIMMTDDSNSTVLFDYVNNGFKVIFTHPDQWRLDCQVNTWVGDKAASCPQFTPTWRNFYENSPLESLFNLGMASARLDLSENRPTYKPGQVRQETDMKPKDYVMGGSASLWTYATDGNSLQSKIYPRLIAFSERLWTDPIHDSLYEIDPPEKRIMLHRERMVQRGIEADALMPEICLHQQDSCYTREQYELRSALPAQ